MKKVFAIAGVMGIMMGMAGVANAAIDQDWRVYLRADLSAKTLSVGTFGTSATASNLYVAGEDAPFSTANAPYAYVYSTVSDGTTDQVAKNDIRSAVTAKNPQTWNLTLAATGSGTVTLKGYLVSTYMLDGKDQAVELWQGNTKLWTVESGKSGSTGTPNYTTTFAYTSPISLTLKAYAVATPEPGSMLAMFSGLVGLVGYGIRRRK